MFKSLLSSVIIISITASCSVLAQETNSIQINGGIIMPMSSSKGLTASFQFNYNINPTLQFYIYTGYSAWDQYKITFHEDYSPVQKQQYFTTYSLLMTIF